MTLHHSISVPSVATGERFGTPSIVQRWPRPSPALVRCAEDIIQLEAVSVAHLLAELQGSDPADRVEAYAALAPLAGFIINKYISRSTFRRRI